MTTTTNDRRLVTIQHAMEITGVSRRTIYNWLSHNKLEFMRTAGGGVRIYADTLFKREQTSVQQ